MYVRVIDSGIRHRIRLVLLLLLLISLTVWSGAQENGTVDQIRPEEPDLELPTVVLEYTAIQRENIDVVLPEEEFISLPEFSEQLPEADRMVVESAAFDVPLPDQPEPAAIGVPQFFSEGVIGGGTDNHLIGDIALYKRGNLPQYQFRFSHEGIDGYGGNAPGEGYFDRREELSGSLESGTQRHAVMVAADYTENETGLQGFSGASSIIHRFLDGSVGYRFDPDNPLALTVEINGHSGSQYLGSQDREREVFAGSEFSLLYERNTFLLGTAAQYAYLEFPAGLSMQQGGFLLQSAYYGKRFDLSVNGGIHWDETNEFLFPFVIRLEGAVGERWQYRFEGGYVCENLFYTELWEEYPLLDTADSLDIVSGWNASGFIGFNTARAMRMGLGAEWRQLSGIPVPDNLDVRDPVSGLFPFSFGSVEELEIDTNLTVNLGRNVEVKGGWKGLLLRDAESLDPAHSITAELAFENTAGVFGAGLDGEYGIDPTDSLPRIGGYLQYRVSDGILLVLEGNDFFAPFYEEGRPWWGEYEARGFYLTLKTEISL